MFESEKQIIIEFILEKANGTNHPCTECDTFKIQTIKKYFKGAVVKRKNQTMVDYSKIDILKYPDLYLRAYRIEIDWVNKKYFQNP